MGNFKRLCASILALGVAIVGVVLVAPAASAHATSVTGKPKCQSDGTYTVTWTIANDFNLTEKVAHVSHVGGDVTGFPADIDKKGTTTVQSVKVPGDATSASLTVRGTWSDGFTENPVKGTVTLDGTCGDNGETKKVDICHATPPDTAKEGWNGINVSVNSIVTGNGHDSHKADIIPPFTYLDHGKIKSYDGKNWDSSGQAVYKNGCQVVEHRPSGKIESQCEDGGAKVVASKLDAGTFENVEWRLVTGTAGHHDTVVPSQRNGDTLVATGVADKTTVWLQFKSKHGDWTDEGSSTTTNCPPPVVVQPTGDLDTTCDLGSAVVTASHRDSGTFKNVQWRLVDSAGRVLATQGSDGSLVAQNVAAGTKVHLQFRVGTYGDFKDVGPVVTAGDCQPTAVIVTQCVKDSGQVVATVNAHDATGISWRLVTGTDTEVSSVQDGTTLTADGVAAGTHVRVQFRFVNERAWHDAKNADVVSATCVPTGTVATECTGDTGTVTATLNAHDAKNVSWRLVTGIESAHHEVVGGPVSSAPLTATKLADSTLVWLQYSFDGQAWKDVAGAHTTSGICQPTGELTADCFQGSGRVVATVRSNQATGVTWRLVTGTVGSHDTVVPVTRTGDHLTATGVADGTTVWLQYTVDGTTWRDFRGASLTTGVCTPAVVAPTGSFTVACSADGANVTLGTLNTGNRTGVVWTLTHGGTSTVVASGDVVAVPAGSALALAYKVGAADSVSVQTGTAPAACPAKAGGLTVNKSVDATSSSFGSTLTYRLLVTATGQLGQTGVVVSDVLPGYKPGTTSGRTTYVADSAVCDAGTCTAAYDDSSKTVTWALGDMAAGSTRTVTFKVTINQPTQTADGGIPAVTILNSAAVQSTETSSQPSNEVRTDVTAVEGVKQGTNGGGTPSPVEQGTNGGGTASPVVQGSSTPNVLPHTGLGLPLNLTIAVAALLMALGTALAVAGRRREVRVTND